MEFAENENTANTNSFTRYVWLKLEIKRLEAELKELQPAIIEEVKTERKTEFGTFKVNHRKKWTYPEHVNALDLQVKGLKKQAEANGSAQAELGEPYITFKAA